MSEPCTCGENGPATMYCKCHIEPLEARIRELQPTHKTIHEQAEAAAKASNAFGGIERLDPTGSGYALMVRGVCAALLRHAGLDGECEG